MAHRIMYRRKYHQKLNLEKPETIDDKLHWLMINEFGKNESNLTDKILVKELIKQSYELTK